MDELPTLRVLVCGPPAAELESVHGTVAELGHKTIARSGTLSDVAALTASERPDVALVVVGKASAEALDFIDKIVHRAACPVIVVLAVQDRAFVNDAARRGIFAYIVDRGDPAELQSSIDIVLRRFSEYHALEGAFGSRALTERAKGILMERHDIDEHAAFQMLRTEARRTNRKITEVAEAVVEARAILPGPKPTPS